MTDDLVPEGFSLDEARRRKSSTPLSERPRCTNCGSRSLTPYNQHRGKPARDDAKYRCGNCGCYVDDPEVPEP